MATAESSYLSKLQPVVAYELEERLASWAWSPEAGGKFLAGLADGRCALLDRRDGQPTGIWEAHALGTLSVAWNRNGQHFATSGQDRSVYLHQLSDWQRCGQWKAQRSWVTQVAWCPHREDTLVVLQEKTLQTLSVQGDLTFAFQPLDTSLEAVGWHPVLPNQLVGVGYGGGKRFRQGEAKPTRSLPWAGTLLNLIWNPADPTWVASTTQDNRIHAWNLKEHSNLNMHGYPGKIHAVTWDPSGHWLATSASPDLVFWDFRSRQGPKGAPPLVWSGLPGDAVALAYHPQASLLLVGCETGHLLATPWTLDPQTKRPPKQVDWHELGQHPVALSGIAVSPDGTHFASFDVDGNVIVWGGFSAVA
jgi:WD40 repeat protein